MLHISNRAFARTSLFVCSFMLHGCGSKSDSPSLTSQQNEYTCLITSAANGNTCEEYILPAGVTTNYATALQKNCKATAPDTATWSGGQTCTRTNALGTCDVGIASATTAGAPVIVLKSVVYTDVLVAGADPSQVDWQNFCTTYVDTNATWHSY